MKVKDISITERPGYVQAALELRATPYVAQLFMYVPAFGAWKARLFDRKKKHFPFLFNCLDQGCQMVYFQTKNTKLGKFWRPLDWKMLIYFMVIWNILQTFGIFYRHLGYFMTIKYILCSFGTFLLVLVSCTKKNLATLV
jgi:hypothetical protein